MGRKNLLILSVLLVAPSALAGPLPDPQPAPHQQQFVLPWSQGAPGGFIYCAGCSPINPQQLVIPSNVPAHKAIPLVSASGVLPPGQIPTEKQLNSLGVGNEGGQQGSTKIWGDGFPVQQMALHDDGRYSFSYNTADGSRQEERNLDGSVSGSYSYTDPNGKLVQIDYTAGPHGYNAFGENVPPQNVQNVPQAVRDTPEVQAAREQFLQAYASELARHQQDSDTAHSSTTVVPSDLKDDSEKPTEAEGDGVTTMAPEILPLSAQNDDDEEHNKDESVIASGKAEPGQDEENNNKNEGAADDDETDSIVISADDAAAVENRKELTSGDENSNNNLPSPSYQITIPIGVGGNAGLSIQQPNNGIQEQRSGEAQAVPVSQNSENNKPNNVQPYFYYVSVGGTPHYITTPPIPGYNSPYPTSLKATLLGALPAAAVHDSQIPNRMNNMNINNMNNMQNPSPVQPVFLDLENKAQEGTSQNVINSQMSQMNQQQNPSLFNSNQLNINHPLLGQLVPIQLTPIGINNAGGASFGYIPGFIFNNNNNGVVSPATQQQNQGSQNNNNMQMPGSMTFGFNMPVQQQQQQQQQIMQYPQQQMQYPQQQQMQYPQQQFQFPQQFQFQQPQQFPFQQQFPNLNFQQQPPQQMQFQQQQQQQNQQVVPPPPSTSNDNESVIVHASKK